MNSPVLESTSLLTLTSYSLTVLSSDNFDSKERKGTNNNGLTIQLKILVVGTRILNSFFFSDSCFLIIVFNFLIKRKNFSQETFPKEVSIRF